MDNIFKLNIICSFLNIVSSNYWSHRAELIASEDALMLGSKIKIQGLEQCVNKTLMSLKLAELDRGLENPNEFYPSKNFVKNVKYIDASEVYNFIKDIPKGAALHLHDMAMASPEYLYDLTFTENLFVCTTFDDRLLLNFFLFHVDNRCEWIPLEQAREEEGFEELLHSQLSMDTPLYKKNLNNKVAWAELMGTYATIEGLISYKPIYTTYLTDVLKKMYEDNVMYVELRTTLLPVYDLDGNDYETKDVVTLLKETLADFQCVHKDFLGGKIIYSPSRMVDQSWMDRYVEIVDELGTEHSDFVAGFDLTGQEDLSYPLSRFINSFKEMRNKLHFFFSAGETNWIGAKADLNLFDAVLLNPTRIGHAFTLFGHPELLKIVKENDIAIELCPISNQMMMLVGDLRNHPGKYLISHGYPIVVSSDNPGFWGARTLSHDWYVVFMAMADRKADLRLLKQLAINSIKYSTISNKTRALELWQKKWDVYMKNMEQWCSDSGGEEQNTESEGTGRIDNIQPKTNSWMTESAVTGKMYTWAMPKQPLNTTNKGTAGITAAIFPSATTPAYDETHSSAMAGNILSTESIEMSTTKADKIETLNTDTDTDTDTAMDNTTNSTMKTTTNTMEVKEETTTKLPEHNETVTESSTDLTDSIKEEEVSKEVSTPATVLHTETQRVSEGSSTGETAESLKESDTTQGLETAQSTPMESWASSRNVITDRSTDLIESSSGLTNISTEFLESTTETALSENDTNVTDTTEDCDDDDASTLITTDTTIPECDESDYDLNVTTLADTVSTDDCVDYIDDNVSSNGTTIVSSTISDNEDESSVSTIAIDISNTTSTSDEESSSSDVSLASPANNTNDGISDSSDSIIATGAKKTTGGESDSTDGEPNSSNQIAETTEFNNSNGESDSSNPFIATDANNTTYEGSDSPNSFIATGGDNITDEESNTPNPFMATGADNITDEESNSPNPFMATGVDNITAEESNSPNSFMATGADNITDAESNSPNPFMATGADNITDAESNSPNPFMATGADNSDETMAST